MKRKALKSISAALLAALVAAVLPACRLITTSPTDAGVGVVVKPGVQALPSESAENVSTEETPPADTEETNAPAGIETAQSEPEAVSPAPIYRNYLTGKDAPTDASGLRPIAVVVDNSAPALAHQTGLDMADVLYEMPTAPGITRFLAIYSDYRSAPEICNVREGKAHDVKLASQYNAVLICHGGHADDNADYDFYTAVKRIYGSENAYINTQKEPAWSAQNGDKFGTLKYYSDGYRADLKYDTVVNPEAVDFTVSQKKYSPFAAEGNTINGEAARAFDMTEALPSGGAATGITLRFTAAGVFSPLEKNVSFKYSASEEKYLRFEDSAPHVDSQSGKQLIFDNVLVLCADAKYIAGDSETDPLTTSVAVYGSGTGYYASHGRSVSVVWVNTAEEGLKLYSPTGETALSVGNTYIGFVDRTNPSAVTVSG